MSAAARNIQVLFDDGTPQPLGTLAILPAKGREVFSFDDHLRNHGFLLTPAGWVLSPAYDINPNPDAASLSLNITETHGTRDFDLLRSVAKYFRLSPAEADYVLREIARGDLIR